MTPEEIESIRTLLFSSEPANVELGWTVLEGQFREEIEMRWWAAGMALSILAACGEIKSFWRRDYLDQQFMGWHYSNCVIEAASPMPGVIAWPLPVWFNDYCVTKKFERVEDFYGQEVRWYVTFEKFTEKPTFKIDPSPY